MDSVNKPSFRVQKVELLHESEGPDYFTSGEYEVVDTQSGQIVARFAWSLDEPYLTNAAYSGPDEVRVSEDGAEAVAVFADGHEERVLLPGAARPIVIDGVSVGPDTDFAQFVRKVAAEGGPANENGWRKPGGQWLWRVYERLGQSDQGRRLEEQVCSLLADADPRLRACAAILLLCPAGGGHAAPDGVGRRAAGPAGRIRTRIAEGPPAGPGF